jgi:hypothetical protein
MASSINDLQELMQKNKLPMVTIEVKRFGGQDHKPEWGAFAKLDERAYASRKSDYFTKSEAKKDCAQVIYEDLLRRSVKLSPDLNVKSKPVEPMKPVIPIKSPKAVGSNYYIWVDLDNSRHIWDSIIESGSPVKLLRGYGGPRLEPGNLPSLPGGLSRVETTRTNMKDSADYALFADVLLYIDAKVKSPEPFVDKDMILIVSGDSSLETACFILRDRYNIDIRYVAKLSDLF